jgi:regulator of sigma D
MSLGYKKSIILNNIARTKGVDKFCNKILEIINHPRSKLYPEMILNDIKNFCEKRLETNKQVRIESNDI